MGLTAFNRARREQDEAQAVEAQASIPEPAEAIGPEPEKKAVKKPAETAPKGGA
jgi:hypothetical protein